jgi:hypothetical protein
VVESFSEPQAKLYYRSYLATLVGDKFLCVMVKLAGSDAFVLTPNDQVMEKVDADGNNLGFSVLRVSALQDKPLALAL